MSGTPLTEPQLLLLQLAKVYPGVTEYQVKEVMEISAADAGGLLAFLTEQKLLERIPPPSPERYCLTTAGGERLDNEGGQLFGDLAGGR